MTKIKTLNDKIMNKLYSFKSDSIKKFKKIIKYLDLKKIIKAEHNLSVVIIVVIIFIIIVSGGKSKRKPKFKSNFSRMHG